MHASLPWTPPPAAAAAAPAAAAHSGSSGAAAATPPGSRKARAAGAAAAQRAQWVSHKDFNALCNKTRSAVAKPGYSDSANAALHE
jgi:hypothetical protein